MPTPKVSVIVPTYRHRDLILLTLDSVFQQTMSDYEIIVVNDGSPDDTRALLAPLIESDRIVYLEQTNMGQSQARNRGLAKATGEYIAFLDDDDLWPPDKLEWQVEFLEKNEAVGLVAGTLLTINEHGAPGWAGQYYPTITFETLFTANPFLSPGQTLIRADVVQRAGGLNSSIWGADDWDLWFRIASQSTIVMLDRVALYYRLHPGNASKQTARLLKASCSTIEHHLKAIAPDARARLRQSSQRTLYKGLGAKLVATARGHVFRGEMLAAMKSLGGLLPLRRGILFDGQVRAAFVNDVLHA
jgi:glycosyltransferase involved in cell wall biosynthesis